MASGVVDACSVGCGNSKSSALSKTGSPTRRASNSPASPFAIAAKRGGVSFVIDTGDCGGNTFIGKKLSGIAGHRMQMSPSRTAPASDIPWPIVAAPPMNMTCFAGRVAASRPWRKSVDECRVERAAAAQIFLEDAAAKVHGVDADALFFCMVAQEFLTERCAVAAGPMDPVSAQVALDSLRQVATNASKAGEVDNARGAVVKAFDVLGIGQALREKLERPKPARHDVCSHVLPGLFVGGWAGLGNNCAELKKHRITHVVSVISSDQRGLPDFIKGHLHFRIDDRENAAEELGRNFPEICRYIDLAREHQGAVFVHCGAGISRAPTCAAAYLVWKLGIPAADAMRLVQLARPCTRPNLGFVRQLCDWDSQLRAAADRGDDGGKKLLIHQATTPSRGRQM